MLNITGNKRNANQTAVTYHLKPVRMAISNKTRINVLERVWRGENPCKVLVEMQTGAATKESWVEVPQKVMNRATISPSIVFLKILKTLICNDVFTAAHSQ